MRSRIRSKKARDRKKNYLKELEIKVKMLETENFRLQNLLIMTQKEKLNITSNESK